MNNNDILRRLRYTFDFNDSKMMFLFGLGGDPVKREQVTSWLKKFDDPDFKDISDTHLATFLNGLIVDKRGKKDGVDPKPENQLTNNAVLMKLKIALNLKAEDVLEIFKLADVSISKHELSAFFRKPTHKHYRECQNQMLRNFLKGLQVKYRA